MFKTYILQSLKDGSFYYGHSKDVEQRLKSHNAGKVRSTKARRPWKLYYFEEFETKSQAYRREMFFKTIDGYNYLRDSGIIKK
ncbi:MAG: GIY-YIG nuclease family protein [Cyclobacteriaceae bacterium]|nr:GIY-YIG nuclease family protein [Cyclobacteriaceae bacterium]